MKRGHAFRNRLFGSSLLALGMLMAFCGSSMAQGAEYGKAWVWADRPTTADYIPNLGYQYNSTHGTNRVLRFDDGPGHYLVYLPGLGTTGGIVHVTAYGGNHTCKTEGWESFSSPHQYVYVRCFSPNGAPANGKFTLLFYNESPGPGDAWRTDTYLLADQPTTLGYYPRLQWNSKGLRNTVGRISTGRFLARLYGMNEPGGTVLVTAVGTGPERCKVASWWLNGSDTEVDVRCFTASGAPVNTPFALSFTRDLALGLQHPEHQDYGGYVWFDGTRAAPPPYQLNTYGGTITVTRLATGSYRVHLPNLQPWDSTTALLTAYGTGSEYCTVGYWVSDGSDGTHAYVTCFNSLGTAVNAKFTLLYLTDENILY